MEEEIWRDVENYEGYYQISNLGRVKSVPRKIKDKINRNWQINGRILKHGDDGNGYHAVKLCRLCQEKTVKVARLVAKAFIPNPENKPQINHKDGDKDNNIAKNLEWCTGSENLRHAVYNNLRPTKLSNDDILDILSIGKTMTNQAIADIYGVGHGSISRILNHKTRTIITNKSL